MKYIKPELLIFEMISCDVLTVSGGTSDRNFKLADYDARQEDALDWSVG